MSKKGNFQTTRPVLCFDDFSKASIPTKLNNLKVPERCPEPEIVLSVRQKQAITFPMAYMPKDRDVVVQAPIWTLGWNLQFQALVRQSIPIFMTGKQQRRKNVVQSIMKKITSYGGHFIRMTPQRVWQEVDSQVAERYVSNALNQAIQNRSASTKANMTPVTTPIEETNVPTVIPNDTPKPTVHKAQAIAVKFKRPSLEPSKRMSNNRGSSPVNIQSKGKKAQPRKVSLEPPSNPLEMLCQLASAMSEEDVSSVE
jgi:hypothetical protein